MTAPCALALKDVTFAYQPGADVLRIAALEVASGQHVFLHGPSGSGKTTLLGLVTGLLTPQHGQVHVLGRDLGTLTAAQRDALRGAEFGYIFQLFNLIPYLDVRDNITLPCRLSRERQTRLAATGQGADEAAAVLAARLGIAHLLKRSVTALSVGQQQRVAAARALLGSPPLIIADEPTSALDQAHRQAFIDLLFTETQRTGATLLFVSHDLSLAPLFQRRIDLASLNSAPSGAVGGGDQC